ncbi:MAG: L-rhamnose catabolism isomerase [Bacteroidia bacterium]
MRIHPDHIERHHAPLLDRHRRRFAAWQQEAEDAGIDTTALIDRLARFQVAIPSWALGTGGTRFGRFAGGGEPRSLEEKLEDVGLLYALDGSSGAISLHIPWDIPTDPGGIREQAASLGLRFDAVNSNTFQDQPGQPQSYKFGSLCHSDAAVRRLAVAHNIEVIGYGEALGSKALTVWLPDGSNFPGQHDFRAAHRRTLASLAEIYAALPADWSLLLEYKPYEPHFYSMVIPDWGTSLLMCSKLGAQAHCLVDLGHHLPNTNIEQIVAILQGEQRLGGFHFNDSKYGDDDLSVGCIKPYQLFLIFQELVKGMDEGAAEPAWMIDASHNLKDPLEDLIQSVGAIRTAYARALLVSAAGLRAAQEANDVTLAQELLHEAFATDVRPLLAEVRLRQGAALDPLQLYRDLRVRAQLVATRGSRTLATGL